jgi:hypothetical protein
LQKRPPEGGDERSENVQWTFSAKNARPVDGPGGGRCPARFALDSGQKERAHARRLCPAHPPLAAPPPLI